jgi:predicted ATPase with chaperone activity
LLCGLPLSATWPIRLRLRLRVKRASRESDLRKLRLQDARSRCPGKSQMNNLAAPASFDLADSSLPVGPPTNASQHPGAFGPTEFLPHEPATLEQTGLLPSDVEPLILKLLLNSGSTFGRRIAEQLRLPFGIVAEQLRSLKGQLMLNLSNQGAVNDFEYALTDDGHRKAHWYAERCTYCGAAPVPLEGYIASVEQQSIRKLKPKLQDVCNAFSDLLLPPATLSQLGQAIHAGRALFLYGEPGNGKTSIAERLIRAIGQYLWIPRTIKVASDIIRLYDPANHEEAPLTNPQGQLLDLVQYDRRWVRIRRPVVMVGGELRLEQLEITHNPITGILESPVQLKSNGGTLVVDDFGRQRCSIDELLNRWIVPLETRRDFLNLPSGRQLEVPFDQLLVFSTNLPPHKLVDEAFLRRIPYKIEVSNPSPRDFRELMQQWCDKLGLRYSAEAVDHLLAKHFSEGGLSPRYSHPRDLVQQVVTFCEFHDQPLLLTSKALDVAVKNLFAGR